MLLTITACDLEGDIHTTMTLRLVMHYSMEKGVMYEIWDSPDFPLPQPMISEILTFLEAHICAPVSPDRYISKAEIPASLIAKLMGPAWMTRFRQIVDGTNRSVRQISAPAMAPDIGFHYQDAGFDVKLAPAPAPAPAPAGGSTGPSILEALDIIDKAAASEPPPHSVAEPSQAQAMEIEISEGVWMNASDLPPSLRPKNKPTR